MLTRSVVVICSSRYLQHPTLTSDIMRKHYNHLIPNFIVTRSLGQPHPTLQILRRTSLLPGQFPANKRDSRPVSCAGNTNYHNCRAVSNNCFRADNWFNNLIQSLFGGSPTSDSWQILNLLSGHFYHDWSQNLLPWPLLLSFYLFLITMIIWSFLITVMASANMPPQGGQLLVF